MNQNELGFNKGSARVLCHLRFSQMTLVLVKTTWVIGTRTSGRQTCRVIIKRKK